MFRCNNTVQATINIYFFCIDHTYIYIGKILNNVTLSIFIWKNFIISYFTYLIQLDPAKKGSEIPPLFFTIPQIKHFSLEKMKAV